MTQNLQPPSAAQTAAVADTNERFPRLGWRNGAEQAKTPGFSYKILRRRGISVYVSTLEPHLYIVVNPRQRGLTDHVTAAALVEQAGLDAERPQ